ARARDERDPDQQVQTRDRREEDREPTEPRPARGEQEPHGDEERAEARAVDERAGGEAEPGGVHAGAPHRARGAPSARVPHILGRRAYLLRQTPDRRAYLARGTSPTTASCWDDGVRYLWTTARRWWARARSTPRARDVTDAVSVGAVGLLALGIGLVDVWAVG